MTVPSPPGGPRPARARRVRTPTVGATIRREHARRIGAGRDRGERRRPCHEDRDRKVLASGGANGAIGAIPELAERVVPQQSMVCAADRPQVCRAPAASVTYRPGTRDGAELSPGAPTPICPERPLPQQYAAPSAVRPHVWFAPAASDTNDSAPATRCGVVLTLSSMRRTPSCPLRVRAPAICRARTGERTAVRLAHGHRRCWKRNAGGCGDFARHRPDRHVHRVRPIGRPHDPDRARGPLGVGPGGDRTNRPASDPDEPVHWYERSRIAEAIGRRHRHGVHARSRARPPLRRRRRARALWSRRESRAR